MQWVSISKWVLETDGFFDSTIDFAKIGLTPDYTSLFIYGQTNLFYLLIIDAYFNACKQYPSYLFYLAYFYRC